MSTFRLEMFDGDGKLELVRHVNISGINTVDEVAKSDAVKKIKKEAALKGLAFRIVREDA